MNDLYTYFLNNTGRMIFKWNHYFPVYEQYLNTFRNKQVKVLEIGCFHGGSLQMWKYYFGKEAQIIGLDINPLCKTFEEDQVTVEIGDQANKNYLQTLINKYGEFDIVIDDGGHEMEQQIVSAHILFPAIKDGGVYICEDTHSSYLKEFVGTDKQKHKPTFMDYVRMLMDEMHNDFKPHGVPSYWTENLAGIHIYNSMVVLNKQKREEEPRQVITGNPSYEKEYYLPWLDKYKPEKYKLENLSHE